MTILFQIDTDLITLKLESSSEKEIEKSITATEQYGLLHIKPKRNNIILLRPPFE